MSPWKNLEEEGLSRQDFRRNLGMLPVDLKKMTNPEMMLQECRLKITKILQLEDPPAPTSLDEPNPAGTASQGRVIW